MIYAHLIPNTEKTQLDVSFDNGAFHIKDSLKAMGFKFNPVYKNWSKLVAEIPNNRTAESMKAMENKLKASLEEIAVFIASSKFDFNLNSSLEDAIKNFFPKIYRKA